MTEQAVIPSHPKFLKILVFKNEELGSGSYGAVYKAKCDDSLICAAKLLHRTLLFHPVQCAAPQEDRLPINRFEQECEFMSTIRHPNVVQYLGTGEDPETGLRLLLMELMDGSLTDFIENHEPVPIPYHIQVNICHDITLALSFLHSNKIIHRDLSGKNVLMISNVRAKVTDFGMARLSDLIHPQKTRSLTQCPGTPVYMPPEAVKDKPVYTEKMDCFSFGVILVQILTLQFPDPGDRRIEIEDHRYSSGVVEIRIPEIERRQNHISKIDVSNPLLSIALTCLKDDASERPSAQELCTKLEAVKTKSKYSKSQQTSDSQRIQDIIKNKDQTIAQKDQELAEKNEIITIKQNENQQLRQELEKLQLDQQVHRQNEQAVIKEKDQLIAQKEQALVEKDDIITFTQIENHRLMQQLRSLQLDKQSVGVQVDIENDKHHVPKHDSISFTWAYAEDAPCKMSSPFNAAFDKHVVQVRVTNDELYAYHTSRKVWSKLPDSPTTHCPSVIVNNSITLIGGYYGGDVTNKCFSLVAEGMYSESKLFNFTGGEIDWNWMELFPPMQSKRCDSTALNTETALIVAGGDVLSVEVMSIVTRQWSVVTDLPKLLKCPSAVICGNSFYILDRSTRSVYSCSLTKLLLSKPKSDTADTAVHSATVFQFKYPEPQERRRNAKSLRLSTRRSERRPPVRRRNLPFDSEDLLWKKLADVPVIRSTCVSFLDRLLSIGGEELEDYRPTNVVHIYDPILDSWTVISHMSIARYNTLVATLPNNQLMVIGGVIDLGNPTERIEIATIQ